MLRFAIIGCGRVAENHVRALAAIPRARLVAVCDLVAEKARRLAPSPAVAVYTNYHELLQREAVDVVNIVTPSGLHATHALDIMTRYRKHVVVEKPMALRVEDCAAMIACARQQGVQLHVVLQNRFNRAVQHLRTGVDQGRFGRLVLGTVRLRWCRPQRYYDQAPWRGTWALDGGALTNQAIHHLDLLQWLLGEVDEVSAVVGTRLVNVAVEDTAAAWVRFRSGALGVVEATTAARPDDLEASVSLLGEHGTAIVEGPAVNRLTTWTFGGVDPAAASETPPNVYGFGHQPLLASVVNSVLDGAPPAVDGAAAMVAVRLLHALYRSAECGAPVLLADEPRSARFGVVTERERPIYQLYVTPPPA